MLNCNSNTLSSMFSIFVCNTFVVCVHVVINILFKGYIYTIFTATRCHTIGTGTSSQIKYIIGQIHHWPLLLCSQQGVAKPSHCVQYS